MTKYLVLALAAILLVALGGTAAASGYIITKPSQIKPSVRNALKGQRGPMGPQGAQGIPGALVRRDPRVRPAPLARRDPRVRPAPLARRDPRARPAPLAAGAQGRDRRRWPAGAQGRDRRRWPAGAQGRDRRRWPAGTQGRDRRRWPARTQGRQRLTRREHRACHRTLLSDMSIPLIWGDTNPPGTTVLMKAFPVELAVGEYMQRATLTASVSGMRCPGTGTGSEQAVSLSDARRPGLGAIRDVHGVSAAAPRSSNFAAGRR